MPPPHMLRDKEAYQLQVKKERRTQRASSNRQTFSTPEHSGVRSSVVEDVANQVYAEYQSSEFPTGKILLISGVEQLLVTKNLEG